jgi:hypothetical protein
MFLKCSRFIRMENVRRLAEVHAACGEGSRGGILREVFGGRYLLGEERKRASEENESLDLVLKAQTCLNPFLVVRNCF